MSVREALVNAQGTELRMLAVVPHDRRAEIARQLAPLKPDILFLERFSEAQFAIREDGVFQVALLPASLSDTDWWEFWGVLSVLNSRPAILVYAREVTFQLWSGVLELGCYDVIVDPFSDETLQRAVSDAAKSFEERRANGSQPE
jgi:DNA-binding NtrC family response regulator